MPTEFVMLPPQTEKTREWGARLAAALPELKVGLRLTRRALNDRRAEQPGRPRRHQVIAHRHAARGFAGDRYFPGIATESGDARAGAAFVAWGSLRS